MCQDHPKYCLLTRINLQRKAALVKDIFYSRISGATIFLSQPFKYHYILRTLAALLPSF